MIHLTTNWGYEGERGPDHWHELSPRFACGIDFPWQSPIDLNRKNVSKIFSEEPLKFFYQSELFFEEIFNNTFHFIPPEKHSYLVFSEKKYYLTDIHFHLPSEHTLEQKHTPIEFHFVHMNEEGHNLVVGVLFEIADIQTLIEEKPMVKINWQIQAPGVVFNPALFLPKKKSFYSYIGSLTTPPTLGEIQWFVMDQVQTVQKEFVEWLKNSIVPNNNRPVQPLNEREIWYRE